MYVPYYRPGRIHQVPDSLSRLLGDLETPKKTPDSETLDVFAFHATLVAMNDDFKTQIKQGIAQDPEYKDILVQLRVANERRAALLENGVPPMYTQDDASRVMRAFVCRHI